MGALARRPWSPDPKVKITDVQSKDPEISLFGDPLIDSLIHTDSGLFEIGRPGGDEEIQALEIHISKGNV